MKNTSHIGHMKINSLHFFDPGVFQMQGSKQGHLSTLCLKYAECFSSPNEGSNVLSLLCVRIASILSKKIKNYPINSI